MKIAYFLDTPKGLGGAGNLLLQQAVIMSEIYDVIVVVPADEEDSYNYEYARRCEQYSLPYVCLKYNTACNFSLIDYTGAMNSLNNIEEFVKREKITFFHSTQLNIAVEYVSRKLKIPHLMDIYQLQKDEFRICPGDIYSHYHLCDSFLYSNMWSQQLNIESRCVRPVALLDNMCKKAVYVKEKVKFLMLGTLCSRKNQMVAIKAIEQCISYNELELHIAGDNDNDYAEECRVYVREHHLEKFIIFHGFVSNIIPIMENCDCLLCSSIDESFPSSIVEALTYDLTIISTPVAGVPEVFFDKVNSFISKDFSEKSIKESILECLEYYKNGKINIVHRNAERTWEENFARDKIRKQINLYYNDIMLGKRFDDLSPFLEISREVNQTEMMLCGMNDCGEKWIYKRGLYCTFIRKHLSKGKVYIWGAGKLGKLTFEIFRKICPNLEIMAFIDTNKEGIFCDVQIIKLEDAPIEKSNFYCISFSKGREMAVQYLEDKGLILNKQIWIMF